MLDLPSFFGYRFLVQSRPIADKEFHIFQCQGLPFSANKIILEIVLHETIADGLELAITPSTLNRHRIFPFRKNKKK